MSAAREGTGAPTAAALARVRNASVRAWLEGLQPRLLIGDSWVPALSGRTFESIDPVSEGRLAILAQAQVEDVNAAVGAARRAFEDGPWARIGPAQRAALLRKLADLVTENVEALAELESLDNGMLLTVARGLTLGAAAKIQYYAGAAPLVTGETVGSGAASFNYTMREPLGVCAGIVPWNAPLMSAVEKLAPALAAGNTMVLKPAQQTSLSAVRLGELVLEAGFPPGVFNVLTGSGSVAGQALAEHRDVDKVGFTGSTQVGKQILLASAGNLKRLTLELGGKSPNIVFPDADLELALPATLRGFTSLSGQVCVAGTRVFVQQDFKDEFVAGLAEFARGLRIGDPLDGETAMGPLVSKQQQDTVQGYIRTGLAEGAVVRAGGGVPEGTGFFVEPTVFDGVQNSMRIAQEEIFGPVVAVIPFKDEDDAVLQANDTEYGLSAAVWTSDVTRAHAVARRIKAGTVWINTILGLDVAMPFGGYKQSGLGSEGGPNWFEHYTQEKSVYLKL